MFINLSSIVSYLIVTLDEAFNFATPSDLLDTSTPFTPTSLLITGTDLPKRKRELSIKDLGDTEDAGSVPKKRSLDELVNIISFHRIVPQWSSYKK